MAEAACDRVRRCGVDIGDSCVDTFEAMIGGCAKADDAAWRYELCGSSMRGTCTSWGDMRVRVSCGLPPWE